MHALSTHSVARNGRLLMFMILLKQIAIGPLLFVCARLWLKVCDSKTVLGTNSQGICGGQAGPGAGRLLTAKQGQGQDVC